MRPILRPRPFQRHCTLQRRANRLISTINNPSIPSIAYRYASTPKSTSLTCPYPSTSTLRQSTLLPKHLHPIRHQRSFINIPNIFNNNNNNNTPQTIRTLRASRTLPFPPSPLYEIIASVESYSEFLPFLGASTVTARDKDTGYPSQAFLTVGYGPFTETFTSRVTCDRDNWVVEARSGGGVGEDGKPIPGADEGLFSHLSTKWELVPLSSKGAAGAGAETEVRLEIRFRFQNAMHTAMMSAVEDKVAGVMIEAFERRIKEQMALGR
ncbi:Coenzyme Q-binding protein coq10 [Talaromyces pinophilus]|nr:Coenzyme Q-binding protein coq10 [Talaromyces pinophilus]